MRQVPTVTLVALGAAAVGTVLYFTMRKASAATPSAAALPTPQAPPVRYAPAAVDGQPTTPSPIQSGKPEVIIGPGPFDPVSSDWKRENAPDWWPW